MLKDELLIVCTEDEMPPGLMGGLVDAFSQDPPRLESSGPVGERASRFRTDMAGFASAVVHPAMETPGVTHDEGLASLLLARREFTTVTAARTARSSPPSSRIRFAAAS
jgi:hypothetical protein